MHSRNEMEMTRVSKDLATSPRSWRYFIVVAGLCFSYTLLYDVDWQSRPQFNTILDVSATLMAGVVGVLALVRHYSRKSPTFLLLGIGFFGVFLFDGLQSFATTPYYSEIFPSDIPTLILWIEFSSRLCLSICLLSVMFIEFMDDEMRAKVCELEKVIYLAAAVVLVGAVLLIFQIARPSEVPRYVSGFRPGEIIPLLGFGAALVAGLARGGWRENAFHYWMIHCLILNFLFEIFALTHTLTPFGSAFDFIHIQKIGGYLCIFGGLADNLRLSYRAVDEAGEAHRQARRETEAALHELAQQKRALDEHNMVMIHDAERRLVYVNRQYCEMTGYSSEALIGTGQGSDISNIVVSDDTVREDLFDKRGRGEVWRGEVRNIRKDGTSFWSDTTIIPFVDQNGVATRTLSIGTDISDRKRAFSVLEASQKALRAQYDELGEAREQIQKQSNEYKNQALDLEKARDEARSASLAKTDFLANMSHEIRTPMNGILGMARLLQDTELLKDQEHYVDAICESSHSLLTILNDIIDFVRLGSDRIIIEEVNFKCRDLLNQVVSMFSVEAMSKVLSLWEVIDESVPEYLQADLGRIKQVLLNLVGNAIKFTEVGAVEITVSYEHNDDGSSGRLRFEVADTGIGIPPAAQESLFERFVQADSSTTRKYGGSGLGLAISQGLVELMGGDIGLTSDGKTGSLFWFYVECREGVADQNEPVDTLLAEPLGSLNILVAEDQRINQMYMKSCLKKYGHRCKIANNGEEAIEILQEESFDLILMDIQMPVLDGVGATRQIRQSEETWANIPIIAITANALPEQLETYLSEGMDAVLTKPVEMPDLMAAIERIHRQKGGTAAENPDKEASFTTTSEEVSATGFSGEHNDRPVIVDQEYIQKMATDLGVDDVVCLLQFFVEDAVEILISLREAVVAGNFDQARDLAHGLHGVAGNTGARRLQGLAKRLQLTTGQLDTSVLDDLEAVFDETRQWVEGYLALQLREEEVHSSSADAG